METLKREVIKYRCGSVWYWNAEEHNPNSDRPVIIIADERQGEGFSNVIVLPITKTERGWITETPIVIKDGIQSYIQGDQIHTVQTKNLGTYYGDVSEEAVLNIKKKLMWLLGLTDRDISELDSIIEIKKEYKREN